MRTLRDSKSDREEGRVVREMARLRGEEVDGRLMRLREKRVRVTDSRMFVASRFLLFLLMCAR
jgi:hypothetical protein